MVWVKWGYLYGPADNPWQRRGEAELTLNMKRSQKVDLPQLWKAALAQRKAAERQGAQT